MTMDTKRLANQIARALDEAAGERMAAVDGSNLSRSCYVEAFSDEGTVKIRVSDHDARPTYEAQNPSGFHVGTIVGRDGAIAHALVDGDGDWLAAVAWACGRLGLAVPERIARLIARRDAAIETHRAAMAAAERRRHDEYAARNAARDAALKMISEDARRVLTDYAATTGKRRKHFRSTAKYRRALAELARVEADHDAA